MPPLTGSRRPRSGKPPRLMPTPSEPQPVPLHGGVKAGASPTDVRRVDVGTVIEQKCCRVGTVAARCQHQCSLVEGRFSGIDPGAGTDQQLHRFHNAGAGGCHQQRFTRGSRAIRIGLGSQQGSHHVGIAMQRGHIERRDAIPVGRIGFGAVSKQVSGSIKVILHYCHQQCRVALPGWVRRFHSPRASALRQQAQRLPNPPEKTPGRQTPPGNATVSGT